MKISQFIGLIRKGDSSGTIVITIPQNFYRLNGLEIGKEYVFKLEDENKNV